MKIHPSNISICTGSCSKASSFRGNGYSSGNSSVSSTNYSSANSHLASGSPPCYPVSLLSSPTSPCHFPPQSHLQDPPSSPLLLPETEQSKVHLQGACYPVPPSFSSSFDLPLRSLSNSPVSSIFSTTISIPEQLPQPPPKGLVSDTSFLTKEILAIGDEALAIYDSIRLQNLPERSLNSHVMQQMLSAYDAIRQQKLSKGSQESHAVQQALSAYDAIPPQELPEESHVVRETLSAYDATPPQNESSQEPQESESNVMQHNPFWDFAPKELEQYFSAAVDVKNALHMRRSMVIVDIGDALEALLPKLSLYEKDKATIYAAEEEMELIKEVCSKKSLRLNFYALESRRSMLVSHSLSIKEKYRALLASSERILDDKDGAYTAAERFLEDPSALKDHRLPFFGTS